MLLVVAHDFVRAENYRKLSNSCGYTHFITVVGIGRVNLGHKLFVCCSMCVYYLRLKLLIDLIELSNTQENQRFCEQFHIGH